MLHLLARFICMQTQLQTILHLIPAQSFKLDAGNCSENNATLVHCAHSCVAFKSKLTSVAVVNGNTSHACAVLGKISYATPTTIWPRRQSYADMRMTVMVCMQGTNFVTWRALVNCASNAALLIRRQQQQQPR